MDIKITGKVIRGDNYGKKIGFPTVNLETAVKEFPPEGIYSGVATLENLEYHAGIVIGPRDKVEAHLIGYSGNAYGKQVGLKIEKFIRNYKKFETEEELKIQIEKD